MSPEARTSTVAPMSEPLATAVERANPDETEPAPGVWCVVVAGGSGNRYGGLKQFEFLRDVRVIDRSVKTAAATCEGVVVVLPTGDVETGSAQIEGATTVVAGGASRAESVRSGLSAVPDSVRYVLVHDGARPLASRALFRRVIDALRSGADAVVPAVTVADTLRSLEGGTIDRDSVRAVQTPQGFSAEVLRSAHSSRREATDDAGLVELLGHTITFVDGERSNLKVTEPIDLVVAGAMIDSGELALGSSAPSAASS